MTSRNAITAFAEQHSFNAAALQAEEFDAIQCAVDCHNAINDGYMSLPASILEDDLTVGFIWQLYERCTERVFGALAAMAAREKCWEVRSSASLGTGSKAARFWA